MLRVARRLNNASSRALTRNRLLKQYPPSIMTNNLRRELSRNNLSNNARNILVKRALINYYNANKQGKETLLFRIRGETNLKKLNRTELNKLQSTILSSVPSTGPFRVTINPALSLPEMRTNPVFANIPSTRPVLPPIIPPKTQRSSMLNAFKTTASRNKGISPSELASMSGFLLRNPELIRINNMNRTLGIARARQRINNRANLGKGLNNKQKNQLAFFIVNQTLRNKNNKTIRNAFNKKNLN
jgi:hypothetical protein